MDDLLIYVSLVLFEARHKSRDVLNCKIEADRATLDADEELIATMAENLDVFEQCLAERKVIKDGVGFNVVVVLILIDDSYC